VVMCLLQGADLHMVQLMPLPLTVSCFSIIQIGFTFLVPAHLGSPGKGPLNGCVCVCFLLPYLSVPLRIKHGFRFYRTMLCIHSTSHGPVSVCLSVTSRCSTKTAKRRITQTTPHDSPGTLVFWCQRSPRNSTGVTPYKGAECRWGGSKSLQISYTGWPCEVLVL